MSDYDILRQTIWAEARGESREGQIAVAWVIKNRAALNRGYWGGSSIAAVCRHPWQFECWNGRSEIDVSSDWNSYESINQWLPAVLNEFVTPFQRLNNKKKKSIGDPTGGCEHYNNPDKEGYPPWTSNCHHVMRIGNHQFYKSM